MKMTGQAKIAGLIGNPISHSKSPLIHNYWMEKYKIDGAYIPMHVDKEDIHDVLKALPKAGLCGVNITVPFKIDCMKYVDELTDEAKAAGAVNTLIFNQNKGIQGHNTDGLGFILNLLEKKPSLNLQNSKMVIFGTGGAARGVCGALVLAGCKEIKLVYRTREKADKLIEEIGGNIIPIQWDDRSEILYDADVLANATVLGMEGFEPLEIDLSNLPLQAIVSDLVYAPLQTELIKSAQEKGNMVADGLGMLLHQARPAFKAWFGLMPEVTEELRTLLTGS